MSPKRNSRSSRSQRRGTRSKVPSASPHTMPQKRTSRSTRSPRRETPCIVSSASPHTVPQKRNLRSTRSQRRETPPTVSSASPHTVPQKRDLRSIRSQRRDTPSTVSSVSPPSHKSSSSEELDESDHEAPSISSGENMSVTVQDSPALTRESDQDSQNESSGSEDEIMITNLSPPLVMGNWAFPTQSYPLNIPQRPPPLFTSSEERLAPFKAYLDTGLPPSTMLDDQFREELKLRAINWTAPTSRESWIEDQKETLRLSERLVLEQMSESRLDPSMCMSTTEEEAMRPVTMEEIDEYFGGHTPPAREYTQTTVSIATDDEKTTSSIEKDHEQTTAFIVKKDEKTTSSIAKYDEQITTSQTPLFPIKSAEPPSPPRARKRVRFTESLPDSDPAFGRTRGFTRASRSVSASPAPPAIAAPDMKIPKSWERACVADKRASYMRDADKGWAEITEAWNQEAQSNKTVMEISRRSGMIKGSIGRWQGFDVALQRAVANNGSQWTTEEWNKVAAAVSADVKFKVSGEECAARVAVLEALPQTGNRGKGKGMGRK